MNRKRKGNLLSGWNWRYVHVHVLSRARALTLLAAGMGADLERVVMRPMLSATEIESDHAIADQFEELRQQFLSFRVEEADCYSSDRVRAREMNECARVQDRRWMRPAL